ncbi:S-layer protein [Levilactobacillus lanxiensis]|uniref:S-layer protein n=1 Tax=Levilactobacillus lanxiensis TaxID=2799568 RepID=A0ABW4D2Q6_9LACO|nr:S-layer protein [Levilactobacillus lanxiensis]
MQAQLAKSLYLGLAALSLGAVATVTTTATTADAASKAKVVSKSSLGKDSKNVELTGTNAIYSKPGTVKGAKTVASKKTVKKLASSTHSKDYFRAYYMAVTNRGTVYYKVVSMNGKYRGYIYGGKVKGTIGAGIKEAQTTKEATMPTRTAGFHIKDVKKNTLWTAPQHTTYKAHKVNMYGTTKEDTFTVSKAETKTKEGSLYYYVTSDKNSDVSGWIFAGKGYNASATTQELGGLSMTMAEATPTENNSVTVNYLASNGNSVGKSTFITTLTNTKKDQHVVSTVVGAPESTNVNGQTLAKFAEDSKNAPAGYMVSPTNTIATDVIAAVYGGTMSVKVYAAATSKVSFFLASTNGVDAGIEIKDTEFANGRPAIEKTDAERLTGDATKVIATSTGIATDFFTNKKMYSKLMEADKDYTTTVTKGKTYYVEYTYNPSATLTVNKLVKYGETIRVVLDKKLVQAPKLPDEAGVNNSTTIDY